MEAALDSLLHSLFENKGTDIDELKNRFESILRETNHHTRFLSFVIMRTISNKYSLLNYLEAFVTKMDKLTKSIKKSIVEFITKLIKRHHGSMLIHLENIFVDSLEWRN